MFTWFSSREFSRRVISSFANVFIWLYAPCIQRATVIILISFSIDMLSWLTTASSVFSCYLILFKRDWSQSLCSRELGRVDWPWWVVQIQIKLFVQLFLRFSQNSFWVVKVTEILFGALDEFLCRQPLQSFQAIRWHDILVIHDIWMLLSA